MRSIDEQANIAALRFRLPADLKRSSTKARRIALACVLALLTAAAPLSMATGQNVTARLLKPSALDLADGPYVDRLGAGRWRSRVVATDGRGSEVRIADGAVRIPTVADVPGFKVRLRAAPTKATAVLTLEAKTPIFVVADTHGEYPILVALLRSQGIIDSKLRWAFGKGHMVVTGDMLDRGPHQLETLWLLYKLEGEARRAGGAVHVLLGNHEAMILRGDLRYLHPRYPEVARRLGVASYAQLLGPDTVLGAWLRSRPVVLKLGDLLFLHGGISPEVTASGLSPAAINALARRQLDVPHGQKAGEGSNEALVAGSRGPLWYRGYFARDGQPALASTEDVTRSLERFGVSKIFVGHTIVDRVTPLYDGKVIAVQVYPHRDERSGAPVLEGALRINGQWYRATAQGQRTPLGVN